MTKCTNWIEQIESTMYKRRIHLCVCVRNCFETIQWIVFVLIYIFIRSDIDLTVLTPSRRLADWTRSSVSINIHTIHRLRHIYFYVDVFVNSWLLQRCWTEKSLLFFCLQLVVNGKVLNRINTQFVDAIACKAYHYSYASKIQVTWINERDSVYKIKLSALIVGVVVVNVAETLDPVSVLLY